MNFLGITKPSEAIFAMCDGLIEQDKREDFIIDMLSYGGVQKDFCCGCAATCTLQKLAGKNFNTQNIAPRISRDFAIHGNVCNEDLLSKFEYAIDDLRTGCVHGIYQFFSVFPDQEQSDILFEKETKLPVLNNGDWKEGIQAYLDFATALQEIGY